MNERYMMAQDAIKAGVDGLKQNSMNELNAIFCNIVKCPTAPKFSDKTAAAKRILKMAEEVVNSQQPESLPVAPVKKAGRPKQGPREYIFLSEASEEHVEGIAKQAQVIHQNAVHNEWIMESSVQSMVEDLKANGVLQTKQSSWRIFQYYRSTLISRKLLRMRNVEQNG